MRLLHWNCHGLARPAAVSSLRAAIRKHNPDCLFLVETKISQVHFVMSCLGFVQFLEQPPRGSRGGLAFTWQVGVEVEVTSISHHFLNLLVFFDPGHIPWMLTLVYGPTLWHDKRYFWEQLAGLANAF